MQNGNPEKEYAPIRLPLNAASFAFEAILSVGAIFHKNPIWAWLKAESCFRREAFSSALLHYRIVYELASRSEKKLYFIKTQQVQFMIERCKAILGEPTQADPLLLCKALPAEDRAIEPSVGTFSVSFQFYGFLITGVIDRKKAMLGKAESAEVKIAVDDFVIRTRKVRLNRRMSRFSFRLKRPVLCHFPQHSKLSVKVSECGLLSHGLGSYINMVVPCGGNDLEPLIADHGLLTKKGSLATSSDKMSGASADYIRLYRLAQEAFKSILGRPLFIMFGTLLGCIRNGALIPGDDDFDVAYISLESSSERVKAETIEIMRKLLYAGFDILLNRQGRPMRLMHKSIGAETHIDISTVWRGVSKVMAPPYGCLDLELTDFLPTIDALLCGSTVSVPNNPVKILERYYGRGWRIPDPGYSATLRTTPRKLRNELKSINLGRSEVFGFKDSIEAGRSSGTPIGMFNSKAIFSLYPIDEYEKYCGW
jgi:hypothetical protein